MTQQFLQLFSFHRFRQTVGHKAFQTRFFPVKKARKEKLTFRLYFQGKKIIFRTRAIWVGIFWHGTHQQKMEWKKQKTFDTPQTISFFQLYIQVVCKVLYLSENPRRPLQLKVCSAQKASVCISSNFMFWHGVWKSQKKSNSTLRAKRAYILSVQKFIKTGQFGKFLKTKARGQTLLPYN